MKKTKRGLLMIAGITMILCSLYEPKVKPLQHDKTIQKETKSNLQSIRK